jgi:acetoacetyl-CoA synthetase
MPLKFWNDKNDIKLKMHILINIKIFGIMVIMQSKKFRWWIIIYGRSDTTLNPGGVRLGTAEIYSEVEKFKKLKSLLL